MMNNVALSFDNAKVRRLIDLGKLLKVFNL